MNLLVRGSRRLEAIEHAFPRVVGGDSGTAAKAENAGFRDKRKRALVMCMSEAL